MKLNQRAKKLAAILLESSVDNAGAVHTSLQQLDNLIKKDARFRSLLQSKRISNDKRTEIIRQVIKAYDALYKEKAGIVSVQAHIAQEMDTADIDALQQNLQRAMNKKADLKIEVDGQLLGGIKLRIENTFLDASLKSKLNRLQTELLQS